MTKRRRAGDREKTSKEQRSVGRGQAGTESVNRGKSNTERAHRHTKRGQNMCVRGGISRAVIAKGGCPYWGIHALTVGANVGGRRGE